MNLQRMSREIRTLLLSASLLLPFSVLIQKLLLQDLAPWTGVLWISPCFLAHIIGRILYGKNPKLALPIGILSSLAVSAIPMIATFQWNMANLLAYVLIAIFTCILFAVTYLMGTQRLDSKRFFAGLILFLLASPEIGAHAATYRPVVNTGATLFLIWGLFLFSRGNLQDATRHGSTGGTVRLPPGMRPNNSIFVLILTLMGLLVANFESVKAFVSKVLMGILKLIAILYDLLGHMVAIPFGGELPSAENPFAGGAKEQNPLLELIARILMLLIAAAIGCFILYSIARALARFFRKLPGWMDALLDRFRAREETSYIDETESLFEKGTLARELSKRLRSLLQRASARPLRFDQLPDNRAKVRFVFRRFLIRSTAKGHKINGQTPTELTEDLSSIAGSEAAEFIRSYNQARYSPFAIPDEDAERAKRLMKHL